MEIKHYVPNVDEIMFVNDFIIKLQEHIAILEQYEYVNKIPYNLRMYSFVIPECVSEIVIDRYLLVAARGVELRHGNWVLDRMVSYDEQSRTLSIEFCD